MVKIIGVGESLDTINFIKKAVDWQVSKICVADFKYGESDETSSPPNL